MSRRCAFSTRQNRRRDHATDRPSTPSGPRLVCNKRSRNRHSSGVFPVWHGVMSSHAVAVHNVSRNRGVVARDFVCSGHCSPRACRHVRRKQGDAHGGMAAAQKIRCRRGCACRGPGPGRLRHSAGRRCITPDVSVFRARGHLLSSKWWKRTERPGNRGSVGLRGLVARAAEDHGHRAAVPCRL